MSDSGLEFEKKKNPKMAGEDDGEGTAARSVPPDSRYHCSRSQSIWLRRTCMGIVAGATCSLAPVCVCVRVCVHVRVLHRECVVYLYVE